MGRPALKAVLEQALKTLRQQVSEDTFNTYFTNLEFLHLDADTIVFSAPDEFFADWVREHYKLLLEEHISKAAAYDLKVRIEVASPPKSAAQALQGEARQRFEQVDTGAQPPMDLFPVNPHSTFDRFVTGPNNNLAYTVSLEVAKSPVRTYNPLFIYGGTGLGKTHLLNAIANKIRADRPQVRITYISAEEFTNQVVQSIHNQKMEQFRSRFRTQCDVLLVDDVHVLSGKERTQEEFFHTFNALSQAQKQIVFTCDRPPQEIPRLEDRLRSRFQWGLVASVQPPQLETRIKILNACAQEHQLELMPEVAHFIAKNLVSNVRELEGALTLLSAHASLRHKALDLNFAKRALSDLIDATGEPLTLEAIQRHVAAHYDLNVADLNSSRRQRAITHPRSVAMYLVRKHTQASFPSIGKGFGGKDHSTVIAACQRVESQLSEDESFRTEVEEIERRFYVKK